MDTVGYGPQQSDRMPKQKSSTKQLELHVASVYTEIAQMIQQKGDLEIEMPMEVATAVQRINLIKSVIAYILDQPSSNYNHPNTKNLNQQGQQENQSKLGCVDCQNYEKNLQKLEGEIRNHIRTHQQLKLYQDGLEEKIQEFKKEKKQIDKKYQVLKKKYQEAKLSANSNLQKCTKLEQQNQRIKNELRQSKQVTKIEEPKKQLNRYESNKENLSEWRNNNFNERERTSIEKRPESTERMRVSVNVRSTKGIPISSKIVQQKAKQDKNKILKNRLGF